MKISTHYRQDPDEGIPDELRDFLDKEYFNELPYVAASNPKVLVVFAGGNAVGKSTLARRLEETFKGLRIENDAIKELIIKRHPELAHDDKRHHLTWQYTMDLYKRLDSLTSNGLVIRDGTIAWYYDRLLPIFEKQGYKIFVIGYDLSEQKMRSLIDKRGDTPTTTASRLHQILPDHFVHNSRFFAAYPPDIMLTDENLFEYDPVITALQKELEYSK